MNPNRTSPNHALQRTAPCVTAPASAAAFPPTMQVPRRTPRSLSLRSLAVNNRGIAQGGTMARPNTLNYRDIAFQKYPAVCVYCGFGIRAVLEVAHLDCEPANCAIGNLPILCPTCHRMHDIDLIPTELIVRLRDHLRQANWKKLMKNAVALAMETKRATPGLLSDAAKKAVATRRKRKLESVDG